MSRIRSFGCSVLFTAFLLLTGKYTQNYAQPLDFAPHRIINLVGKKIRSIIIEGNSYSTDAIIRSKLPLREKELFLPTKTSFAIRSLYELGYYDNIQIVQKAVPQHTQVENDEPEVDILVRLFEKPRVEQWLFEGNKHLVQTEIEKKLSLSNIKTITEEDLVAIKRQIKKLYADKDYHNVAISSEIKKLSERSVKIIIKIIENKTSSIRRVRFEGNNAFSEKILKALLFSREGWVFGFFNKAGSYRPEALDYDKYVLENFYRSNGFIAATVKDVKTVVDPRCRTIDLTFVIEEGDRYIIDSVAAPENECFSEKEIKANIPLCPGMIYSQEMIKQSIQRLKQVFSSRGYLYADVQPGIIPDKETKKVAITFHTHLGEKMFAGNINVRGNRKTRDCVIRRQLVCCEGELLTQEKLDESKARVERLGFFDPQDGVNWKIHRVDSHTADLDLLVHERKTGKLFVEGSFGPGQASDKLAFKFGMGLSDTNVMGSGLQVNLNTRISYQDTELLFSLINPWLFDRPINASALINYSRTTYEDIYVATKPPIERLWLGDFGLGFISETLRYTRVSANGGFDSIKYNGKPVSCLVDQPYVQLWLDYSFKNDRFYHLGVIFDRDIRNHPVFPNNGYHWAVSSRFGLSSREMGVGFFKGEADLHWYSPIINAYDLILHFHGHLGLIAQTGNNRSIPYRELYHIGGPTTVRGFTWGQIGPNLRATACTPDTSIGAKKAMYLSFELIFPLKSDMSMRGLLFYDGGAGWDAPCANLFPRERLLNNKFNYRHAVGFGLRMTAPAPIMIDWGFKLDRNKRRGEKPWEVHFTMSQAF